MGLALQGTGDTLKIGGRTLTNLTNLIQLKACVEATTTVRATFRKNNATSGYVVPASKQFRVVGYKAASQGAASTSQGSIFTLGYADNDVGFDASTAFTNPVYQSTSSINARAGLGSVAFLGSPGSSNYEGVCDFVIPTGKYPVMQGNCAAIVGVELYGYEESV